MLRAAAIFTAGLLLAGCVSPSGPGTHAGLIPTAVRGLPQDGANAGPRCPRYRKGTGILPDGDFHKAADPGGSYATFNKGQVLAPQWKATQLNVNLVGTMFWDFDHLCSVDLDGESAVGAIAHHSFATKKGAAYTLSFLLSGNSYCGPTVKKMLVSVGGRSVTFKWNVSNGHDVEHGKVEPRSLQFNAASSSSTLSFTSLDTAGSGCGPVIGAIGLRLSGTKLAY